MPDPQFTLSTENGAASLQLHGPAADLLIEPGRVVSVTFEELTERWLRDFGAVCHDAADELELRRRGQCPG